MDDKSQRQTPLRGKCSLTLLAKAQEFKAIKIRIVEATQQLGVFALDDIRRWSYVASYEPFSKFKWIGPEEERKNYTIHWATHLIQSCKNLSDDKRKAFWDIFEILHPRNEDIKEEDISIFMAKKIDKCAFGSGDEYSLFLDLSFYNHSCRPNCIHLSAEDGSEHLFTLRDVNKGEELTICYQMDMNIPNEERKLQMKEFYGFDCTCESCLNPTGSFTLLTWIRSLKSKCVVCHTPSKDVCKRCKVVDYCSVACQKVDWDENHKRTCSQLKKMLNITKINF